MRKKAQQFFEITNSRRTLRFFSSDPIPKDVIHNIIRAAGENKFKKFLYFQN